MTLQGLGVGTVVGGWRSGREWNAVRRPAEISDWN